MKIKQKQTCLNVAMGCIAALALLAAPQAWAFPSSGTCGMLVTQPVPIGQTMPAINGLNLLAVVTFTSAAGGTVSYQPINGQYLASGPVANVGPATVDLPFTLSTGPIPGTKKASLGNGQILTMIAVNNDKTVLVQGYNTLAQGVCQF